MEIDWILDEIATGLQKLYLLSLDRTPAAELLAGTAQAWCEAITTGKRWEESRDLPRFRAAFVTLAQTRTSWPAPMHFLDALPRVELAALSYEVKPASREDAAAAMRRIREMLAEAGEKPTPTFKPEPVPREKKETVEEELRRHYGRDGKAMAAGADE